jgi:hypothetical protein
MKILFSFLIPFLLTINMYANVEKVEKKLEIAKTNIAKKLASYDLQEEYLKQIKKLNTKIEKKLDKKKIKFFLRTTKTWFSYYNAEKTLITSEFNDQEKYGTSGALISVTKENDLLRQRYDYLKKMLNSL